MRTAEPERSRCRAAPIAGHALLSRNFSTEIQEDYLPGGHLCLAEAIPRMSILVFVLSPALLQGFRRLETLHSAPRWLVPNSRQHSFFSSQLCAGSYCGSLWVVFFLNEPVRIARLNVISQNCAYVILGFFQQF